MCAGCDRSPRPISKECEVAEKKEEIPLKYVDRRVVERYLKRGLLDEKEYARYLKALEDVSEAAGKVETEFAEAEQLGPVR